MSAKKNGGNDEWKIVIAEDSATQREQLEYILETHGYQVVAAGNGKEALALIRLDRPDIVISDIVMPEMDGYDLCKQIKMDEKLKDIPVVLLTALSNPADVIKGLECGADNFVTKPYDERVLLSRIEFIQMNRGLQEIKRVQMGVEITFSGQKYFITSDRLQILNLLLSTYESAVSKNRELEQVQAELRRLNEQLEQRVKERTAELVKANEELKIDITKRELAEHNLSERVKELKCLYGIDMIGAKPELTLDDIYKEVVNLLPQSWQYPEITGARLTLQDKKFETKNYKDTDWKQSAVIKAFGVETGEVQIVYLEEKPELDEGPFMKEERHLITSVAKQLARITEAKQAEEEIKHLTLTLRSIRNVNQLITREKNREKLLQEACRLLTATGGYSNAWIVLLDESGKLLAHAESGWGRDFLPLLEQLKLGEIPACGRQALEQVPPVLTDKLASTSTDCPLPDRLNSKVALTARLEHAGKVYGLLSASMPGAFATDDEKGLFNEVAGDIAFALNNMALEAKQKELENAILTSEEKYRDLYSNAPTPYFSVSLDGYIKESNKAAQHWLGYSEDELREMMVFDLYPEELKSRAKSVFDKRFKQGLDIINEEMVYQRKDGKKVYGMLSASLIKDKNGQVVASRSVVIDISERKKVEEQLRIAEQNFRNSLDDSPLGIRIGTVDRKLLYANKAILDIWGYGSVEELKTTPAKERYTLESYAEHEERGKRRRLGEPVPSNYESSIIRKDGKIRHLSILHKEVIWNGETQIQVIYQDITEQKIMQEQLIITDRLASVGELAAGIAHELNNPLTGVIGFSDLLLQKDVPDDIREDLEVINREAKRTADVVRSMLTFARKHEARKEPVNINTIIKDVLRIRAYEQRVNNIEVKANLASDLPEVIADAFRLQQVFLNIIINAEHFMGEVHGKGILSITTERTGDVVRAAFADDGPGIAREHLGHIFDPFFTTKEVGKGTGLGLSICHGIITEEGGHTYAESKPGEGATFVVELPISARGGESNEKS
ncbi:PAS domain S-box protein [Chloroflexota bacterium]